MAFIIIRGLIAPLTAIINQSITDGQFPSDKKEALVTPVLKKGNSELITNYRPVSCLPVASKLLESVIWSQMIEYLESNHLLPENQHGVRSKRSAMSAWETIHLEWA